MDMVRHVNNRAGDVLTITSIYKDASIPAGNTIANTATETTFASQCTITANTLKVGTVIRIVLRGVLSTTVLAPSFTGKIKIGSLTFMTIGPLTLVVSLANGGWDVEATFVVTSIGASGTVEVQGKSGFASGLLGATIVYSPAVAPLALDTTVDQLVTITGKFGAASAANTITLRQMLVYLEN